MSSNIFVQQPFPIPSAFFLYIDEGNFTQQQSSFSNTGTRLKKKVKPKGLGGKNSITSVSKYFKASLGINSSANSPVKVVPAAAILDTPLNTEEKSPTRKSKKKNNEDKADKSKSIKDLLSTDRPTVILTRILERIAKKEREMDRNVDTKADMFHKLLANPAYSALLPVPTPGLPKESSDWLESPVLLEALVDEDDTVHLELTILFRAVCEANKQHNDKISEHFLNALRLLLRFHKELQCPLQDHRRFWAAHSIISTTALAAILSRLCQLNKCRNYLIDILRLAAKTTTFKENGFLNFSHFPLPKRPLRMAKKLGHHQQASARSHVRHVSGPVDREQAMSPGSILSNPSTAVPAEHATASVITHSPQQIRASAFKSIQIFRRVTGIQAADSPFDTLKARRASRVLTNEYLSQHMAHDAGQANNWNNNLPAPIPVRGSRPINMTQAVTEAMNESDSDSEAYDDSEFLHGGSRGRPTMVAATHHNEGEAALNAITPPASAASTARPQTLIASLSAGTQVPRNTAIGAPATRVLQQQRRTSLGPHTHHNKIGTTEENAILASWIEDWTHTLPWKVDSFVFGAVEMLPAAIQAAAIKTAQDGR